MEAGHISIHAENILPIIKRWLYSEKEIYIRELVSNAADAILKLQKLSLLGEVKTEVPDAAITLTIDKPGKRLIISDTGLGMTADEIKKYINQVAFSGLHDFLDKYKDKDDSQQVIGHFGLGFYSSFMVASKVEIDTLSYKEGAVAARWSCDGSTAFELSESDRKEVGTSIILHIGDDSAEMLEVETIKGLIHRYCAFIRYPIKLADSGEVLNETRPLWTRSPTELTDKDYIDFFQKLFPGSPDPLFWIHLNVDYPFNLKGVLYFPKLKHELDASQGEVKLYCNQVYVADNTKELIPEFLTLLKGVIDCPDLPLNVSRSYLQNDPTVRKISEHITKKVADKLSGMAKTERETYAKFWDDIHPFIKFGMLRDHKFFERMQDYLLFKTADGEHLTLDQYKEKMTGKVEDGTVIYASDPKAQVSYLRLLKEEGMEVVIADTMIDQHFIPYFEMQTGRKWKFKRIDSDLSEHLLEGAKPDIVIDAKDKATTTEKIDKIFRDNLDQQQVKIRIESFKSDKVPAMLLIDENARRLKDMARSNGAMAAFAVGMPEERTLVVNQNSPAIKNLLKLSQTFNRHEEVKLMVNQIFDLAWLQQGEFSAEMMQSFIDRSAAILGRLGVSDVLLAQ
ncbi:MAG: molecular chaperone HtpG [Proteobacteria bacterium]|nr:molecular chaperone HtpG [Pseudomonadota bacterium]